MNHHGNKHIHYMLCITEHGSAAVLEELLCEANAVTGAQTAQ